MADAVRTTNNPYEIVAALLVTQGRKVQWLAARAGMNPNNMASTLQGLPGYPWKPGQQEAIAGALGVPASMIWGSVGDDEATAQGEGDDHAS